MKMRSLSSVLVGLVVTGATFTIIPSSLAAPSQYMCAQFKGVWTTWNKTYRGTMSPLIRWKNDKISDWSPKERCIEVSKRMQRLVDNRMLSYLTGGTINSQPVICGVAQRGDPCSKPNLVLTLPPGSNPEQAIEQITNISARADGRVLTLSGHEEQDLKSIINGQTYINMETFQEVLEVAEPQVDPSQLNPVK